MLGGEDLADRRAAAGALPCLGEAARPALPALRRAADSPDPALRLQSLVALWCLDPEEPDTRRRLGAGRADPSLRLREAVEYIDYVEQRRRAR